MTVGGTAGGRAGGKVSNAGEEGRNGRVAVVISILVRDESGQGVPFGHSVPSARLGTGCALPAGALLQQSDRLLGYREYSGGGGSVVEDTIGNL